MLQGVPTIRAWVLVLVICCALTLGAVARPRVIPKQGPCSTTVTPATTMYASTLGNFYNRTYFSNTTTVLLYLSANITLTSSIVIGPEFSCTIIKADPILQGVMPSFIYPADDQPVIRILGPTNLIFIGVGFIQNWQFNGSLPCSWTSFKLPEWTDAMWTCPSVFIYRGFNIQISQSYIAGRTDVMRSGAVEISYSTLNSDNNYWLSITPSLQTQLGYTQKLGISYCTIRFMLCGDPVNLVRANNRLTNNVIRGSWTTVFLYMGAVGTVVQNNFITDFEFGGLQCGMGVHNVADCMLNTFELNYILQTPGVQPDSDGAGIYYDLHWFNPGNRDSCNYIERTQHCYYLDYTTSALLVEGAACINTGDGIKVNTGKMNMVTSIVHNAVSAYYTTGFVSCQNWCINRCGGGAAQEAGNWWWNTFRTTYANALWNTNYPYLNTFCTDLGYTVGGTFYPCNPSTTVTPATTPSATCLPYVSLVPGSTTVYSYPSANSTGNCSGIPALNTFDFLYVQNFTSTPKWLASYYLPTYSQCELFPAFVAKANTLPTTAALLPKYLPGQLGFNDETVPDYGADNPSAFVYQLKPSFYSCPRRLVGPQTAYFAKTRHTSTIYSKFNRYAPSWYHRTYAIYPVGGVSKTISVAPKVKKTKRKAKPIKK